jgi:ribosomal protein S15P/S13E
MTETATISQDPQRLRALERANQVRLARADLKRRIADGKVPAASIILNSPWEASSWAVGDLLMSQRRWGSTRCQKFLRGLEISETKQIGTLTQRQRVELASHLDARTRDVCSPRALELVGAA